MSENTTHPKPATDEAIALGCICQADKQTPNWSTYDTKCPLHTSEWLMAEMMKIVAKPKKKSKT